MKIKIIRNSFALCFNLGNAKNYSLPLTVEDGNLLKRVTARESDKNLEICSRDVKVHINS